MEYFQSRDSGRVYGIDNFGRNKLEIVNGENEPVTGTFEFAGLKIPVKQGKGSLAYADFVKGKHEPAVWLHRKGIEPIPGILTFA